jgi:hypothetical protein
MPQSNALPQRGQRALLPAREGDGFMTDRMNSLKHRSGNDATTGEPPLVGHSANSQARPNRGTLGCRRASTACHGAVRKNRCRPLRWAVSKTLLQRASPVQFAVF